MKGTTTDTTLSTETGNAPSNGLITNSSLNPRTDTANASAHAGCPPHQPPDSQIAPPANPPPAPVPQPAPPANLPPPTVSQPAPPPNPPPPAPLPALPVPQPAPPPNPPAPPLLPALGPQPPPPVPAINTSAVQVYRGKHRRREVERLKDEWLRLPYFGVGDNWRRPYLADYGTDVTGTHRRSSRLQSKGRIEYFPKKT